MSSIFWWIVFPYICLTILVLGTFYRFVHRRMDWVAPSTEIFEKKMLSFGSRIFHWGIVFAFLGHVMGVLIPKNFYEAIGVDDHLYHFLAIVGGGLAGLMVVIGLIVFLIRKRMVPEVRVHTTFGDYFTLILLLIVAGLGTYMTIIYNTTVVAYEYRETIGPWFRSLLYFQPKYQLMYEVPLLFQVHVIASFLLFASIPFTKLVHMFSLPVRYPARAPQQYRSRDEYKNGRP